MSYLTQAHLTSIFDVPFNLPQSRLAPGESAEISSFNLALGQKLRVRWLNLHILKALDNDSKLNSSFGAAYVGLYSGAFHMENKPTGIPIKFLSHISTGVVAWNPYHYQDFTAPGVYSLVLVNNLENSYVEACVTGTSRIYLHNYD